MAADQTGSGTVFTARGQHFGNHTANDNNVTKGTPLDGLARPVECVALPLRNDAGEIRSEAETDALVLQAVDRLASGGGQVLLQAMDCSKLGWRAPSDALLQDLATRWPHQVQIVIDACQMRLSRRRIARYLDRRIHGAADGLEVFHRPAVLRRAAGAAGACPPPRCGRVRSRGACMPTTARAIGRATWSAARAQLPAKPNFGQWLRWETALDEITGYYAVPDAFRRSALASSARGLRG